MQSSRSNNYNFFKTGTNFETCLNATDSGQMSHSEKCQLIHILLHFFDKVEMGIDVIGNFFLDSFLTSAPLTLDNLASKAASALNKSVDQVLADRPQFQHRFQMARVAELYLYFFPIIEEREDEGGQITTHLLDLGKFSDLEIGLDKPELNGNPHLGDILKDIMNLLDSSLKRPHFDELALNAIAGDFPGNSSSWQTTTNTLTISTELGRFLNNLSPQLTWFSYPITIENELFKSCPAFLDLKKPLMHLNTCRDRRERCLLYCQLVDLIREVDELMIRTLTMTMEQPPTDDGHLDSFPICKMGTNGQSRDCWVPVITDIGPCFSTFKRKDKILVNGAVDEGQQLVLMDGGSESPMARGFQLFVSPPGHFAANRFINNPPIIFDASNDVDITVEVTRAIKTTQEFKAMSLEKRNCYYPEEKKLQFFPIYSEPNCFLECAWFQASEACKCVPWYLRKYFPRVTVCEYFGNTCFQSWVDKRYRRIKNNCTKQCLNDCEGMELVITSKMTSDKDRKVIKCENQVPFEEDGRTNLTCQYSKDFIEKYKPKYFNLPLTMRMDFASFAKRLRLIRISFKKMGTIVILKTATMTIIDMISNIGGTLGLFSGFSLLSGVEILYWLALFMMKRRHL